MTPQTPIIDRNFKGVGRIKRATGTTAPKMRAALSNMLTALHEQGRLDVLRSIRDGLLPLLVVYDAYRRHALDSLPSGNTLTPLGSAMSIWIDNNDAGAKHKVSQRTSLKYLADAKKDAVVAELPVILEELRDTLGVKHPRSFNLARSHALRFVGATLKRNHPLYLAIGAVEKRKEPRRREGVRLTPTQLRGFFPNPDTDPVDRIAWDMATTGMHEKEYWHDGFAVLADRVRIYGQKRGGRNRFVPLVRRPEKPTIHERTFTDAVRDRTSRAIQPYDLRRTFAHWMEAAGIPRTRRMLYMGHGARDVTDLYERHEVEAFVVEDAAKLRAYLDSSPTKVHTMRPRRRVSA